MVQWLGLDTFTAQPWGFKSLLGELKSYKLWGMAKIYIHTHTHTHTYIYISQRIAKIIFKKKNVGGFAQPDFKTYLKVTEIKTVQYWHKDRHEWIKTGSPKVNCYIYQLIFLNWGYNCLTVLYNKMSQPYMCICIPPFLFGRPLHHLSHPSRSSQSSELSSLGCTAGSH